MRTDIFTVGARLLGVWQLVGALGTLAYLLYEWLRSYPLSTVNHEYQFIRFGIELIVGLYLVLRPYHLSQIIERFAETVPPVTDINEIKNIAEDK
jgi:uncharacterized membrane protein